MTRPPLNRLDATLQQVCPMVMMPLYETLPDLETESHRFLAAQDGIYLDAMRPWLQLRIQVADSMVALPYGHVEPRAEFQLGSRFQEFVARFIDEARAALPNEHAAWLSFDLETRELQYEPVDVNWQNGGHINYQRPRLPASRRLAIDIHSHGTGHAGFSPWDDKDDIDDIKLAIVLGRLHRDEIDVAARLVLIGGASVDYSDFVQSLL